MSRATLRQILWAAGLVLLVGGLGAWAGRALRHGPPARVARPSGGAAGVPVAAAPRDATPPLGKVVRDGIRVEFRVDPAEGARGASGPIREGQGVRFRFRVSDTAADAPLAGLFPAAWVVPAEPPGGDPAGNDCVRKVEALMNANPFTPPELDLNVYYVLTLNEDATVSVVDPLFGFGGTKTIALVPLASPGADWVLGPGGKHLFVALPASEAVAVIDTGDWTVAKTVPVPGRPTRLALQRDGRHIWACTDSAASGLVALSTDSLAVVARLPAGRGGHDIAFDDESRYAAVTSRDEGMVTVVDLRSLRVSATLRTGPHPWSVAYSSRARLAYVADDTDGSVTSIDLGRGAIANRIVAPGKAPGEIRFAPGGRVGFVVNPRDNSVEVLDPALNRFVRSIPTDDGPDSLSFTDGFAYVRHRRSEQVLMIALASVGREGQTPSVVRFPGGRGPSSPRRSPTAATSIVAAPGAAAVLAANPADRSIYYYKEGMAAPMGTFRNDKRTPTAVLALDRSLRERSRPGEYEALARLRRPGKFDVVFFLNSPRIVHCFTLDVPEDPALAAARDKDRVDITPLVVSERVEVGATVRPLVELTDHATHAPRAGVKDFRLMMQSTGGDWHELREATEATTGLYGASFRPPSPGTYLVFVECESLKIPWSNPGRVKFVVREPEGPGRPTPSSERSGRP